jgi:hypothetical protein
MSQAARETMRIDQAREAARHWLIENAESIAGFCGAYTAGSTNWLRGDAELPATTDLDIMVVVDRTNAGKRHKFLWQGILLEVSYLSRDQFQSPQSILGDYHLAPSFVTTRILLDPAGSLTALLETVRREYAKQPWVSARCTNARNKILQNLNSIDAEAPLHDQLIALLFAAGIACHVLLVAGLRNPTIRARYAPVRELLADYGHIGVHESLLELLGVARMNQGRVAEHLATLTEIFDRAANAIATPFPFAADIREDARAVTIGGSVEMIERGYHRAAMFWIAVTHSRCQKVILSDAPEHMTQTFRNGYRDLVTDLGLSCAVDVRRRAAEIERFLPKVWEVAQSITAANPEVENE